MKNTSPVRTLIDTWPTRRDFAEDVGAKVDAVHKWAHVGRIPSSFQMKVVEAARRRGIEHATADWMLSVHAASEPAGDAA